MVCTYLLYLQVSGMFHIIVGLLHLFGFNLPEGNHHYVLRVRASRTSGAGLIFTGKDFMMKVFFYPLSFRLWKLGTTQARLDVTLIAFFATWALHAYQWFWLRGAALFTPQEDPLLDPAGSTGDLQRVERGPAPQEARAQDPGGQRETCGRSWRARRC